MRIIMLLISLLFFSSSYALKVTSSSLKNNTDIHIKFTCDDADKVPALEWNDLPPQTQSVAIIMSDPDAPAGTWYHWVVYNMPNTTTKLKEGQSALPPEATIGKNTYDKAQYNGPCPPRGSKHHYIFTVYALDLAPNLPKDLDGPTLETKIQGHVLAKDTLVVTYARKNS